jgi:hypothetical protein
VRNHKAVRAIALLFAGFLAGCASYGQPSQGIASPAVAQAYLPLSRWSIDLKNVSARHAAALVVAPHVAVTNAHNADLLPDDVILGQSDFDLLFFRTEKVASPAFAKPSTGQAVIAYGGGGDGSLREARGRVLALADPVEPRCRECRVQPSFAFDADGGPGFSGGPLVDAKSGAVVGIVFGYCEGDHVCGAKRMFAFDMDVVQAEMRRLLASGAMR